MHGCSCKQCIFRSYNNLFSKLSVLMKILSPASAKRKKEKKKKEKKKRRKKKKKKKTKRLQISDFYWSFLIDIMAVKEGVSLFPGRLSMSVQGLLTDPSWRACRRGLTGRHRRYIYPMNTYISYELSGTRLLTYCSVQTCGSDWLKGSSIQASASSGRYH